MHCLEVIVARNARAAGRELAHADAEKDRDRASRILDATPVVSTEFVDGYSAGRKDC